jgi:hypothetical protein
VSVTAAEWQPKTAPAPRRGANAGASLGSPHHQSACTSSAAIAEHALARFRRAGGPSRWPTPASFTTTAGRYPGGYLAGACVGPRLNAALYEWPRQEMLRGAWCAVRVLYRILPISYLLTGKYTTASTWGVRCGAAGTGVWPCLYPFSLRGRWYFAARRGAPNPGAATNRGQRGPWACAQRSWLPIRWQTTLWSRCFAKPAAKAHSAVTASPGQHHGDVQGHPAPIWGSGTGVDSGAGTAGAGRPCHPEVWRVAAAVRVSPPTLRPVAATGGSWDSST